MLSNKLYQRKSSSIRCLEYFFDGCIEQDENFKNFFNLTHHCHDLNFAASWSFFATSHGKSSYDEVDEMIKQKPTQVML